MQSEFHAKLDVVTDELQKINVNISNLMQQMPQIRGVAPITTTTTSTAAPISTVPQTPPRASSSFSVGSPFPPSTPSSRSTPKTRPPRTRPYQEYQAETAIPIKDLTVFYEVAKEKNISHAAKNLNYVQSGVTMRMKQLENELGVPLFYMISKLSYNGRGWRDFDVNGRECE